MDNENQERVVINKISKDELNSIIESITQNNPEFTFLDLSDKKLYDEHIEPILKALLINKYIINLSFENNFIGSKGCALIYKHLKNNNKIISLNLSKNKIDTPSSIQIGRLIKENNTLANLNLSSNSQLKSFGISRIFEGLAKNKSIKTINLNGCDFFCIEDGIKDGFYQSILNLKDNISLENLNLVNCNINSEVILQFANVFHEGNIPLKKLDISSNSINEFGIKGLAKSLIDCKSLTNLNISDNPIKDYGFSYILHLLENLTTISSINISNTQISASSIEGLIPILNKTETLGEVIFDDNFETDEKEKMRELKNILGKNERFKLVKSEIITRLNMLYKEEILKDDIDKTMELKSIMHLVESTKSKKMAIFFKDTLLELNDKENAELIEKRYGLSNSSTTEAEFTNVDKEDHVINHSDKNVHNDPTIKLVISTLNLHQKWLEETNSKLEELSSTLLFLHEKLNYPSIESTTQQSIEIDKRKDKNEISSLDFELLSSLGSFM